MGAPWVGNNGVVCDIMLLLCFFLSRSPIMTTKNTKARITTRLLLSVVDVVEVSICLKIIII